MNPKSIDYQADVVKIEGSLEHLKKRRKMKTRAEGSLKKRGEEM